MTRKSKKILIIVLSIMLFGLFMAYAAMYGKEDYNKVKDKVNEITQEEVINNNILLNSDFSAESDVLTYDETALTDGSDGHIFENWQLLSTQTENCDFEVTKVGAGLFIKSVGTGTFQVAQTIRNGITKYADKTLTISASINGVVYSDTFSIGADEEFQMSALEKLGVRIATYISSGNMKVMIMVNGPVEAVVNWVQLEEGSVFTGYNA